MRKVFLIGAQKAGTTSLFNAFIDCPDVRTDEEFKDFHIFDNALINAKKHQGYILRKGEEVAVLHAGVNYMYMPSAMRNIAAIVDDVELLVCLRNPVDRAVSAYYYFKQLGLETRTLDEAMNAELSSPRPLTDLDRSYLLQGLYCKALKSNVFPAVPLERVTVLVFEDIFFKGRINLMSINKLLGISYVDNVELQSNAKSGVRFSRFNRLIHSRSRVKGLLASMLPVKVRHQVRETLAEMNKTPFKDLNSLDPKIRQEMMDFYKDDMAQLSEELGINFGDKWK